MAAISPKKKAFSKKKGKGSVFSKAKEIETKYKGTSPKKRKSAKKPEIEVPLTSENGALKLMGLPFTVKDEAIKKWFKDVGAELKELHRCDTPTWKSGMAYATFSSTDLLQKGLKRNKQDLQGRYINVVIKNKKEMEGVLRCVAVLDTVVRLRGLPYTCEKKDIRDFFEGLSICPKGIYIQKGGEAFVRFEDVDTAKKALKKNDCYMGDRYVKVYRCKLPHLTELKNQIFRNVRHGQPNIRQFFGSNSNAQSLTKGSPQKAATNTSDDEEDDLSLESDEEMEEEAASEEEDGAEEAEEEDEESAEEEDDDEEISFANDSDESMEETTPKTKKKGGGDMKTDLSSKGFTMKEVDKKFAEIVKKSTPDIRKSGGKRTSMAKANVSDDEVVPQLVPVTPKLKGTPLPKRLSTGKKGKRRSMFTATPK